MSLTPALTSHRERNYAPWVISILLLTIAYGLLGLTFTEQLSHSDIMQRCVLVDPKMARIWSVGNVEIGLAYLGVFGGMITYFVRIFRKNRGHLIDLGIACLYLLGSFLVDYLCVQNFSPFVALLIGDAIIMTFTVIVSRQVWFQRLLGVFVPIIFLSCGIGHFLEGLSYWQLTYPFNVPWTMVTADIGFAVLVNSARFPAFIRGQDVMEELKEEQKKSEELQHQFELVSQSEVALQQSEERFRAAVLTVGDLIWTNSPDGKMMDEQVGWAAFTGQSYEEYQGYGWANAVHSEDAQPTVEAWNEAVAERKTFVFEHRVRRHDGIYRLFAVRAVPVLKQDGSIREWVGVHTDITERKAAEAEIMALNAQLKRAMTETHHRVKNNLQVIAALIETRLQEKKENVTLEELIRLKQNIQAMGVIHDILTTEAKTNGDASLLPVREVLEKFVPILRTTLGNRSLVTRIDDVYLPGKHTTSLAIIINELVSNAVKHGKGIIEVTLMATDEQVRLEVCDDGSGFAGDFDPDLSAHTGLELIENITRYDLRGETAYENRNEGGARIVITFATVNTLSRTLPGTSPHS